MQTAIITNQKSTAEAIERICQKSKVVKACRVFEDVNSGLIFVLNEQPEIVFFDLDLFESVDQSVIMMLQERFKDILLAVVTRSEQYALSAFEAGAVSYLLKPVQQEEIFKFLAKAERKHKKRVMIRTFGHFDVYVDEEPIYFSNAKAKELIALLIDRRGSVSMETAINVLWEDRPYDENVKQLYRKAMAYLRSVCSDYNINVLVSNRGSSYVKTTEIDCDFYNLLNGDEKAIADFNGEYMFEYPWAEPTIIEIEKNIRYWKNQKRVVSNN